MADAWETFERALGCVGEERATLLRQVLDDVVAGGSGSAEDRLELTAATAVLLAEVSGTGLDVAVDVVVRAHDAGRQGWPDYYLAEVATRLGEIELASRHLDQIPQGFFEARDLEWRAVRCDELRAIGAIERGRWGDVESLVDRLAAAYVTRGDGADLASPVELVEALVRHLPEGLTPLRTLAMSIDLSQWLPAEVHGRVSTAANLYESGRGVANLASRRTPAWEENGK